MAGASHYFFFISAVSISVLYTNVESRCLHGEVPCDEEKCIPRNEWCDKVENCNGGIDENYCITLGYFGWFKSDKNPNKCGDKLHKCGNGICFPVEVRCDGYAHCEDSSDEANCLAHTDNASQTSTKTTTELSSIVEEEEEPDAKTESMSLMTNRTEIKLIQNTTPLTTTELNNNINTSTVFNISSTLSSLGYYGRRMESEFGKTTTPHIRGTESTIHLSRHHHNIRGNNYHSPHHYNGRPSVRSSPPLTTASYSIYSQEASPVVRRQSFQGQFASRNSSRNSQKPSKSVSDFRSFNQSNVRRSNNLETQYVDRYNGSIANRSTNSRYYDQQSRETDGRKDHVYSKKRGNPSPFYFKTNYHEKYSGSFSKNVHRAEEWLMKQRDRFDGWKENTPRALIALSLINNAFLNSNENNLMKKQLELYIGVKIMRNASAPINLQRAAMFINALLASCGDPRDFNGINIVDDLKIRAREKNDQQFVNPLVYLSLCLSDVAPRDKELLKLKRMLNPSFPNEEISKDIQVLALSALACCQHLPELNSSFDNRLKDQMQSTAQIIRSRQLADGSFGNVYNTALILQALFAINNPIDWQLERSLQYLAGRQFEDGSFGDFFATYLAVIALSGRSLVHLRNTKCDNTLRTEKDIAPRDSWDQFQRKKEIQLSLYFGYPVESSLTVTRSVPRESSVSDILRLIDNEDGRFRIKYENDNGNTYVTSIYGLPNDSERGRYWHLYMKTPPSEEKAVPKATEAVNIGIEAYYPKKDDHIVFWYH